MELIVRIIVLDLFLELRISVVHRTRIYMYVRLCKNMHSKGINTRPLDKHCFESFKARELSQRVRTPSTMSSLPPARRSWHQYQVSIWQSPLMDSKASFADNGNIFWMLKKFLKGDCSLPSRLPLMDYKIIHPYRIVPQCDAVQTIYKIIFTLPWGAIVLNLPKTKLCRNIWTHVDDQHSDFLW